VDRRSGNLRLSNIEENSMAIKVKVNEASLQWDFNKGESSGPGARKPVGPYSPKNEPREDTGKTARLVKSEEASAGKFYALFLLTASETPEEKYWFKFVLESDQSSGDISYALYEMTENSSGKGEWFSNWHKPQISDEIENALGQQDYVKVIEEVGRQYFNNIGDVTVASPSNRSSKFIRQEGKKMPKLKIKFNRVVKQKASLKEGAYTNDPGMVQQISVAAASYFANLMKAQGIEAERDVVADVARLLRNYLIPPG
jgi:hypothetical protein